jgi:hypothetical protein
VSRLFVLGALVTACGGDDPLVIFRANSTAPGVTASIQVCEPGTTCTGELAQVLTAGERSAAGALFEVPAGVVEVPIQVLQGGSVAAGCQRRIVSLASTPVELEITVGGALPTLDCPSGVVCGAVESCCNNAGICSP